jgi:hypothetical protein
LADNDWAGAYDEDFFDICSFRHDLFVSLRL